MYNITLMHYVGYHNLTMNCIFTVRIEIKRNRIKLNVNNVNNAYIVILLVFVYNILI